MAWPIQRIANWTNFHDVADMFSSGVASQTAVGFLFRGQADSEWSLLPSLARLLKNETPTRAIEIENTGVAEFQAQAHLYLSSNLAARTTDVTGWWSLMQHYRAPTRLLDWTASIYVAAYFAVEDRWDQDGAIWVFACKDVQDGMQDRYGDLRLHPPALGEMFQNPAGPPALVVVRRTENSDRMIAQQGGFTLCRQPLVDHAVVIDDVLAPKATRNWRKLVIPKELKPDFLRRLRSMNISAHALFPGIDGLGRSVAELLRALKAEVAK